MSLQTPVKQDSIGLTPVQDRLAALKLSSGVRRSPRLANISRLGKIGVGQNLIDRFAEVGNDSASKQHGIKNSTA